MLVTPQVYVRLNGTDQDANFVQYDAGNGFKLHGATTTTLLDGTRPATEMADLVAYLGTLQYLADEGVAARGEQVMAAGGCTACHGSAATRSHAHRDARYAGGGHGCAVESRRVVRG